MLYLREVITRIDKRQHKRRLCFAAALVTFQSPVAGCGQVLTSAEMVGVL